MQKVAKASNVHLVAEPALLTASMICIQTSNKGYCIQDNRKLRTYVLYMLYNF